MNTRELLVIERDPWALVFFQLQAGTMMEVARVTEGSAAIMTSEVVPLTFGLLPSEQGPQIVLKKQDGSAEWIIDGR